MSELKKDPFGVLDTFNTAEGPLGIYRIQRLEEQGLGQVSKLPYSIRVLLEAVVRNCDGFVVTEDDVKNLASWNAAAPAKVEIPFKPARVVLLDRAELFDPGEVFEIVNPLFVVVGKLQKVVR